MGHDTVTDLMLIKGNDKVWSPNERKEILTYAVEEDNTINIVCLDETSSSSDSDGILPQSAQTFDFDPKSCNVLLNTSSRSAHC